MDLELIVLTEKMRLARYLLHLFDRMYIDTVDRLVKFIHYHQDKEKNWFQSFSMMTVANLVNHILIFPGLGLSFIKKSIFSMNLRGFH